MTRAFSQLVDVDSLDRGQLLAASKLIAWRSSHRICDIAAHFCHDQIMSDSDYHAVRSSSDEDADTERWPVAEHEEKKWEPMENPKFYKGRQWLGRISHSAPSLVYIVIASLILNLFTLPVWMFMLRDQRMRDPFLQTYSP